MATKTKVNKSEAIRNILTSTPSLSAKEVVAAVKATGVEVTESLVYAVKKGLKAKGTKKSPKATAPAQAPAAAKVAAPTKAAVPSSNGHLSVGASIAVARSAAEKIGSWVALKEIVDAMQ